MTHPRERTLLHYLDGALSAEQRKGIAEHLAACPRCENIVDQHRSIRRSAHDLPALVATNELWDRIVAQRMAGDRVILPVETPTVESGSGQTGWIAAAAVLATVLAGSMLFTGGNELSAEASVLELSTWAPEVGEAIQVDYRATPKLANEERVELRARLGTARGSSTESFATLGMLDRVGDGLFSGTIVLPDTVVFAALGVESVGGDRVDHDPEHWQVVVHADNRPLFHGLREKANYSQFWVRPIALATARGMAELYPDSVGGGSLLRGLELQDATEEERRAINQAHRGRLEAADRKYRGTELSAGQLGTITWYARVLDHELAPLWRERLAAEYPHSPAAIREEVFEITNAHRRNPRAALAEFERLVPVAGSGPQQLYASAWSFASRLGDSDLLLRWGRRAETAFPERLPNVGVTFAAYPELASEAIPRLREAINRVSRDDPASRNLVQTADDQRALFAQSRAFLSGELGRALLSTGDTEQARKAFEDAAGEGWNPETFLQLARLQKDAGNGDIAGELMARAASDPLADPDRMVSEAADRGLLQALNAESLGRGAASLKAHVDESLIRRRLRGEIVGAAPDGSRRALDFQDHYATVVAFWSRDCTPSSLQLPEFELLSQKLASMGVQVIGVNPAEPSEELNEWVRQRGFTFPILHDVDRRAALAFDSHSYPRYFVIDQEGRIRYDSYLPEDAARVAAVLAGQLPEHTTRLADAARRTSDSLGASTAVGGRIPGSFLAADTIPEPSFTPYDERPELLNRGEFAAALTAAAEQAPQTESGSYQTLLWINLDASGSVRYVRVRNSSGLDWADATAIRLVLEEARFSPARYEGAPVPVWIQIPVVVTVPDRTVNRSNAAGRADAEPTFTPFEVRPEVLNRAEIAQALEAAQADAPELGAQAYTPIIWIYIDAQGDVGAARIAEPSESEWVDQKALQVVREVARFRPAQNQGSPVGVWIQMPVTLTIDDSA